MACGGKFMTKKQTPDANDDLSLPRPSSADLRGKQSVRATFRLTSRAIDTISVVAVHLGIKQKSLFEHLMEDAQTLSQVARQVQENAFQPQERVQKTYVLSRRTLSMLQEACEAFDTPRDALVEYSILRLMPVIQEERKRHRRRKAVLEDIRAHVRQGQAVLSKIETALGDDDPVYHGYRQALRSLQQAEKEIAAYIEKGEIIEAY
jgi:vacuolar-type H+-ATPase catalytic subunit A/Vma1